MPYDGGARVSQLVLAWSFVVVPQQKVVLQESRMCESTQRPRKDSTYVQTGQTVPAEDVLAPFAHHLRTASVLFNRHAAHWTTLYQVTVERNSNVVHVPVGRQSLHVLLARQTRVPLQRDKCAIKSINRFDIISRFK